MLGLSGWARAQDAEVSVEARAHFKVGLSYLNDPAGPRYEDALREFAAAHAAAPSSWKTLNNIGLCALNLERDQEAIDAYEQALALAGSEADSKWRQDVERDLATLKTGLVRVTVKVRPAGATLLDERVPTSGKSVLNRYESPSGACELGIHAGHHRLSAILGSKSDAWEFDAAECGTRGRLGDGGRQILTPAAAPPERGAEET
jgi:tetratricopeptide (TPR) repeat protein